VEWPPPEHQYWIIEPLLDAGLELEQITELVFRLSFEAAVCGRPLGHVTELVTDRSPEIRAAWHQVIGRMLAVDGAAPWSALEG
jgi:hypothetical protein